MRDVVLVSVDHGHTRIYTLVEASTTRCVARPPSLRARKCFFLCHSAQASAIQYTELCVLQTLALHGVSVSASNAAALHAELDVYSAATPDVTTIDTTAHKQQLARGYAKCKDVNSPLADVC